MRIFIHELKRGKISLIIWTAAISFMLGLCVLIFPDMAKEMNQVGDMFSQMGSFSAAFGMDKINFGSFIGFFGIECGNIVGLGGAFFAALLGIAVLAKEEKEHTAEFLLTHPISRFSVVAQKLTAVIAQIIMLNVAVIGVTALTTAIIGESPDIKTMTLIFTAYFIMQLEIAAITFGISAFLKHSGLGIGLGLAAIFYFINIAANLTEDAKFMKYITPFGYTDCADIIADNALNTEYITIGVIFAVLAIVIGFARYLKKDIS